MSDQDGSGNEDHQPRELWTKRAGWARPRGRRAGRRTGAGRIAFVAQGVTHGSSSGSGHDYGGDGQARGRGRGRGGFRGRGGQYQQGSGAQFANSAGTTNVNTSRSDDRGQQEKGKNVQVEDDVDEVEFSPNEEVNTGEPLESGAVSVRNADAKQNEQEEGKDIEGTSSNGK
ncbi:hypothetical protein LTS18_003132 [Coniosporium uncinatum]|uniref:Uncharacterized protein n=1 Tax=Coniosporium uncinatum TaxID=93489 RepID=A0ACC3DBM2_9PEZI|nr:hypothetical protein LTS18_003132 [Coniosporium uncinatum]